MAIIIIKLWSSSLYVSASSDRGEVTEQLVTILPPLEAGASSLLEDIRGEAGGPEDLVIHHGQTWVQDILGNIRVSCGFTMHLKNKMIITLRYIL